MSSEPAALPSRPPLLSIVTVCFNAAATIGETLDSLDPLLFTSKPDVEHIVVDGASTDSTLAVVRSHPVEMRRCVSEIDSGIYDAMNKGLTLATGEYVWFLNSDDVLHPSIAETWLSLLEILRTRRPQILVGEIQMFKDTRTGIRRTRYWRVPANVRRAERLGWHPPHPAFIARRMLLTSIGGFDESKRIAADFKLMTKALRRAGDDVAFLARPVVAMRASGASNGSWGAIFNANRECYSALREIGSSHFDATFRIGSKLLRKACQSLVLHKSGGDAS